MGNKCISCRSVVVIVRATLVTITATVSANDGAMTGMTMSAQVDADQQVLAADRPGKSITRVLEPSSSSPVEVRGWYSSLAPKAGWFMVRSDTSDGMPAFPVTIVPGFDDVTRLSRDPTCAGYLLDGWFNGKATYDFLQPILLEMALTVHWTLGNGSWITNPYDGLIAGGASITLIPLPVGYFRFLLVITEMSRILTLSLGGNLYVTGWNIYGQLGDGTWSINMRALSERPVTMTIRWTRNGVIQADDTDSTYQFITRLPPTGATDILLIPLAGLLTMGGCHR